MRSLRDQGTPLPGGGVGFDGHCCIYGAFVTGYSLFLQVCWDVHKMHRVIVKVSASTRSNALPRYRRCRAVVDSHSRTSSGALWDSGRPGKGLRRVVVLPPVCSHAGTPGNRVGGGQFLSQVKSSQVGIRRLAFAISGWVTIALCMQDWPECYSTIGFAGPFNVCGAVTA